MKTLLLRAYKSLSLPGFSLLKKNFVLPFVFTDYQIVSNADKSKFVFQVIKFYKIQYAKVRVREMEMVYRI